MIGYAIAVVIFLAAAKLHGRQLRLEREHAGVMSVDFRRRSENPPLVVALWRKDRWTFWPVAATVAIALPLVVDDIPWPLARIAFPMTTGFVVAWTFSVIRLRRARAGSDQAPR